VVESIRSGFTDSTFVRTVESTHSGFTDFLSWECSYFGFFWKRRGNPFFFHFLSTSSSIKSDLGALGKESVPAFHRMMGSIACSHGIPSRI
jgi:hypothetical protein